MSPSRERSRQPAATRRLRWVVGSTIAMGCVAALVMLSSGYPGWVEADLARCRESSSTHDDCLVGLATQAELPELCQDIRSVRVKWECYAKLAEATKEPRWCKPITDEDRRRGCITDAVPTSSDAKGCAELEEPDAAWCRNRAKSGWSGVCADLPEVPRHARYDCLVHAVDSFMFDDPVAACGGSVTCLSMLGEHDIRVCELIPASESKARQACLRAATPSPRCLSSYKAECRKLTDPELSQDCLVADNQREEHCVQQAARERGRGRP